MAMKPFTTRLNASTTSLDGALFGTSVVQHPSAMSQTSYPVLQEETLPTLTTTEVDEGRYVHPGSMKLYKKCGKKLGFLRYFPIFGEAVECYGPQFILTLDMMQFLSKGIAYTIIAAAMFPMFTIYYSATTIEYNRYNTVARMGWSIKPFTALISDSFAFFHYKKRWILTFSALVFGAMCSFIMAFLPHTRSSGVPASLLAFLVGFGQANIDILSEGMYARKIRDHPSGGPKMVSSIWVLSNVATVIASVTQGPLSDAGLAYIGMVICGVCMALCAPVLLFNWYEEKPNKLERIQDAAGRRQLRLEKERAKKNEDKVFENDPFEIGTKNDGDDSLAPVLLNIIPEGEEDNFNEEEEEVVLTYCGGFLEFNKEVIVQNWRISLFSFVMAAIVVTTAVITALFSGFILLGVAFGSSVTLSVMFFWALPLVVAKAGFYNFITLAIAPNFGAAMQGFLLENPDCPSSYPQFSYAFYNSITGIISGIAGLAGVVAFSYIFSKSTYRLCFIVTICLSLAGSVFDLCLVKRWNLPAIPDHYFYIFGDAIIGEVIYMLNWMPMCILLAQLCPRGYEAMVYALLASFSNYGQTISSEFGTILLDFVWPVNASTCEFGNLWKLVVLGEFGLPALGIPLTFLLIPKARVNEQLNPDGTVKKPAAEEEPKEEDK